MNGLMTDALNFAAIGTVVVLVIKRLTKESFRTGTNAVEWQRLADQHGLHLDYQYRNIIGIDSNANKVLIYSGKPFVLATDDVTGVESEWNSKTTSNAWGMTFHKNTHVRLFVKTRSMSDPVIEIRFAKKEEMEMWYQRLSVMFDLR